MLLNEKEALIPIKNDHKGLLQYLSDKVNDCISPEEIPVRFVITETDCKEYHCELGLLSDIGDNSTYKIESIFKFKKRAYENTEQFNAVLLIPTGIGADIGGHSGDGGPVARLLASSCDNLITHPNVVNAADINEMPDNALYVEGSIISRLLMGSISLQKTRSNRVILLVDKHQDKMFHELAINSVSAARAALGLDSPLVIKMDNKVLMRALYSSSGRAVGRIEYLENICEILKKYKSQYDAVALSTLIDIPDNYHEDYFKDSNYDMVNPWGGVEAMLTHTISSLFDIPSAHSPMMNSRDELNLDVGIVDPRKSAEAVSTTYLHCVLKGLHRSPRIVPINLNNQQGILSVSDISCLPVIAVKENKNKMKNKLEEMPFESGKLFVVNNYWEAVGVMNALRSGVSPESVRRPLKYTTIKEEKRNNDINGNNYD